MSNHTSSLLLAQEVSPTKAELQQRIQELQKARQEVASSATEARIQVRRLREAGKWQRPEEHRLASAPFPMPDLLVGFFGAPPFYVQVLQVARIDERIFRHYPGDSGVGARAAGVGAKEIEGGEGFCPSMAIFYFFPLQKAGIAGPCPNQSPARGRTDALPNGTL